MKKQQMIFGIRPVIEAIRAGKELDKILVNKNIKSDTFFELRNLAKEFNIPMQYVPIAKLDYLSQANHQGVIAFISQITYQSLEQILPFLFEQGQTPFLLMLDRITDVRNFGAIARSAECAGVHAIIIPVKGGAQINADAIKTSAGALNKIPVCRSINLEKTLEFAMESGVQTIACTEKTSENYFQADFTLPTLLIMGSEEDGISTPLLKKADSIVKIPMAGEIQSLNVSVATGIILFEALKQRLL